MKNNVIKSSNQWLFNANKHPYNIHKKLIHKFKFFYGSLLTIRYGRDTVANFIEKISVTLGRIT